MRTTIVIVRLIATMLAMLLCGTALADPAKPEKLPRGMGKYVIILWKPGSPLPGKPSRGVVKKVEEPDVPKLGGQVLHKRDNERVVILPKKVARQLRKHPAVFLVQRLWMGESPEEWKEEADDSRFDPETDVATPIETDADTNLTWGPKNYSYDNSGNITAIGADTYTYDTAGRLIKAVVGGQTESYEYDSFGNLLKMQITGSTAVTIPVDGGSNRVAGREYDAAGNILSVPLRDRSGWTNGSNNYVWDGVNRLAYIRGPNTKRRMIYDASDEKISTWIVTGDNQTAMHWVARDFDGRPLREFTTTTGSFSTQPNAWIWQQDYIYGQGHLVAGETPEWGGNQIVPETHGGKRHLHLDHLGSVRMVTNDDGRSLSEHDYYPFGITQTPTHQEDFTFGYQLEPTIDSFRFAGHQRDFLGWLHVNTTEYLDYMHARVYDPNWGRFLSVDPGGFDSTRPQTWNRYSYVSNNPINKVDPDGRAELEFTLTTRIPMSVVTAPGLTGARYFHGDIAGTTFRTQQTFRIETDPARARGGSPLLSQRNVAGATIEYNRSGQVIATATATKVGAVSASFVNGHPVANVTTSSANPLVAGAPAIDNRLTITGPASGKTVAVTGTLDGFPSTTLTMTNEKGQTSTIFHFDPRTVGNGPMSLFPKVGDQKVDVSCTDTGKCNGGVKP